MTDETRDALILALARAAIADPAMDRTQIAELLRKALREQDRPEAAR